MNFLLLLTYAIFLCSSMVHHSTCIDFSLKSITAWVTGNTKERFLREGNFDYDGTVLVHNISGSITIKTWNLPKIAIEATKKAAEKDMKNILIDMQLTTHKASINATLAPSALKNTKYTVDYRLIIPQHANIILTTQSGSIKIKNVGGATKAITHHGSIEIKGAINSIDAAATNAVSVKYNSLPLNSFVNLASSKGFITLSLPRHCNATLNAKTEFNIITSEHFITLNPITLLLNKQTWNNLQRHVSGIIGNGGTPLSLTAYNGVTITY